MMQRAPYVPFPAKNQQLVIPSAARDLLGPLTLPLLLLLPLTLPGTPSSRMARFHSACPCRRSGHRPALSKRRMSALFADVFRWAPLTLLSILPLPRSPVRR